MISWQAKQAAAKMLAKAIGEVLSDHERELEHALAWLAEYPHDPVANKVAREIRTYLRLGYPRDGRVLPAWLASLADA